MWKLRKNRNINNDKNQGIISYEINEDIYEY